MLGEPHLGRTVHFDHRSIRDIIVQIGHDRHGQPLGKAHKTGPASLYNEFAAPYPLDAGNKIHRRKFRGKLAVCDNAAHDSIYRIAGDQYLALGPVVYFGGVEHLAKEFFQYPAQAQKRYYTVPFGVIRYRFAVDVVLGFGLKTPILTGIDDKSLLLFLQDGPE